MIVHDRVRNIDLDIKPGQIVLCFDNILYNSVGRDYADNSWAFQPAKVIEIQQARETLVTVKFIHSKRVSKSHFLTAIKVIEQ